MAAMSAPTPKLPVLRVGNLRCTFLHLHLCTALLHSILMTAGGSTWSEMVVPSSVVTVVASCTVQLSLAAVRTKTVAGPVAIAHGLGDLITFSLASATLP